MSRTREMIQEIIEIRKRRRSDALSETFGRLLAIESAFENRSTLSPELLKYFPVGLVACMEGFFRLAIKQLVDSEGVYLDNAERLLASVKLDFQSLKALHGKEITIGDLAAHHVSLSRLESINTHLSTLLGKDFFRELHVVTESRWMAPEGEAPRLLLPEPDTTFQSVKRTFEMRHIICHELATEFEFNLDELEACVFGTASFLRAASEYLEEILNPGTRFMSNLEMKLAAGEKLDGLMQEIEQLNRRLLDHFQLQEQESFADPRPALVEGFRRADASWRQSMEDWAQFDADSSYFGGTGWGLAYSETAIDCARERIDVLTRMLKFHTGSEQV